MKFNSQICTSIEQSRRLLELGLKKETADMVWVEARYGDDEYLLRPLRPNCFTDIPQIPAWSLHRLIEMMPSHIDEFQLRSDLVYSVEYENLIGFIRGYLYDNIIDCIEWLIKEGYFSKEYLV